MSRAWRAWSTTLIALTLSALLALACAPFAARQPQLLVVGVSRDLVEGGRDPYFVHRSLGVWESLSTLDDRLRPVPELAESWQQSADGLSWIFQLRPGVRFHDGSTLDAAAVKLNIDRYLRISPRPSPFFSLDRRLAYGELESVEVVDERTVRFHHRLPTPSFPGLMANFYSAILAPSSFGPDGEIVQPLGSGPYRLGDWRKGEYAELIAFSGYRGGAPPIERVQVRVLPDPAARVAALRAGELDALVELGAVLPDQVAELRADPKIVLREREIALGHYLFFNASRPPFDDQRLRQAVSLMIDREALVRGLLHGYGRLSESLLSPLASDYVPAVRQPAYDPEQARVLARAAIAGERKRVVMPLSSGAMSRYPYRAIGEVIQAQLAPLGLDVETRILDQAAYNAVLKSGDYHLSFNTQGWPNGDPDFIYRRYLHSQGQINRERSFGFASPLADRLIDQAAGERDPARRAALYHELQQLASSQAPVSPLFFDVSLWAHRASVDGLELDVSYRPSLWTARKR